MKYGLLTFDDPKPDTSRKILHVDMDAFYASIEIRDNPSLKNQPVVIAKHPKLTNGRGIVTTCNYIARQYGIHSAMSSLEAYKRCPQAIFIKGNMAHYRSISQEIRQIFYQYTDRVEPLSLDEAYLDVTQNHYHENSALKMAQLIQKQILEETGLTCSVGVSYNKFIAKLASDFHKPSGITLVTPEEAIPFLHALPIKDFYGVGQKSLTYFESQGIKTGSDLAKFSLEELIARFGKMGHSLYFKVRGIHNAPVSRDRERKSLGTEQTFQNFLADEDVIKEKIRQLVLKINHELDTKHLYCQTLTLKIRYADFETMTRQDSFAYPTKDRYQLINMALELWDEHGKLEKDIRLLGISVSKLLDPQSQPFPIQLEL
ncbi:DNA polymerase IV [Facklamia miroungae]|uniref:DNA polymerase IV n=1 Tax=Facklamia miroungae TaxID=120956 RepID=A0A1G7R2W4_9LACT|nr:DNA polymerase IV [Facklamia miroungae]NKZ29164.1 DNA polymerase IV [Facklamia miroungae]SDG05102.1 DNA polymerase-4 [Facklamia miroungae]